jgi:hypothetical protein
MPRLTRALAILSVIVIILIFYITIRYAKESYEVIPIPINQMIAKDEWPMFYADRDRFEISFPGRPTFTSERIEGATEKEKHQYNIYEVTRSDQSIFLVTAIAYFNEKAIVDPNLVLDNIVKEMVATDKSNQLISSEKLQLAGDPAVDFFIEGDKLRAAYRALIKDSTIYVIGYITTPAAFNEVEYFYFRDSFKLT